MQQLAWLLPLPFFGNHLLLGKSRCIDEAVTWYQAPFALPKVTSSGEDVVWCACSIAGWPHWWDASW